MKKIIISILSLIIILIIVSATVFLIQTSSVSNDSTKIEFTVNKGSTYLTIAKDLKNSHLIKSELFYKLYIKMTKPSSLEAGVYNLNQTMSVSEIIKTLSNGNNYNPDVVTFTIPEGKNLNEIAEIIAGVTTHTKEEILSSLSDYNFINTLISKYWFITDDVKKTGIGYPLEGYLFPDTYEILNNSVSISDIAYLMLDRMNEVLSKYKTEIEKSKYNVHEILTLASIVELEGLLDEDRALIAGVFYNRLNINMALGSDVTAFYGYSIKLNKVLTKAEKIDSLYDDNPYNTRGDLVGLPIGPICNPGEVSIEATINPTANDYLYFIANTCDNSDSKTYFAKTYAEHLKNKNTYLTCDN